MALATTRRPSSSTLRVESYRGPPSPAVRARLLRRHGVRGGRRVLGPGSLEDGTLHFPQGAQAAVAGQWSERVRGGRVQPQRRRREADPENFRGDTREVCVCVV